MRHVVDFRNTSDTGEIDAAAIVPINDGEAATQAVFRRPTENARTRTEVLRKLLRQHVMLRDNDRAGAGIWGGGTITFNGAYSTYTGKFTLTSSLFIAPMLSPGDGVGAAAPYIASTKAELRVGTLGNNQAIITSVKKQFEGTDMAKADANRLSVEILNDTAESIALEGATGDVNNVKIKIISGTTTVQNLVDLINNDVTVTQYVTAAVEATSTPGNFADLWGPTQWGTDYSKRFLSGGFPGVVHEISSGNLATFFAAHADNVLQKGDTLAIAYDQIIDETGGLGGTLQSTIENTKTVIPAASLINTRREPARAPNAIPVCKCIDDDTILFTNGAYIKRGAAATLKTDSFSGGGGPLDVTGWTRMHAAPGAHTPPLTIQEGLNNADDLIDSVADEVEAARNSSLYGAQASLDARIEQTDSEISAARTSAVYGAHASLDARIEAVDAEVNTARNSVIFGAQASLDARIEAAEAHARAFVTCTDGTITTGGMYNGATAIQDAVQAAITAGRGERILVRKGNYTWNTNKVFNLPMQILGIEGVTVTLSQASGYAMEFQYASVGRASFIRGIQFTGATKQCINVTGNDTVVEDCSFTTVGVGVRLDGERNLIRGCHFATDTSEAILVRNTCVGTRIADCTFVHSVTTVPAVRFYGGGTVEPANTMENCDIKLASDASAGGPVSAIWVDNGFQQVMLRNITIECQPSNDTGTAVVYLANGPTFVQNMVIRVPNATTDIKRPLFRAYTLEGVYVTNLKVDLGNNWLKYTDGERNPVSFLHRANVDGIQIINFKIPCTSGAGGYSLQYYWPVLRATGGSTQEPARINNLRMDGIAWDGTANDGNVALIGGKGSTDISAKGYSTDLNPFYLTNFYIDAPYDPATAISEQQWIITNVPPGTIIQNGRIIAKKAHSVISIIGCGDNDRHGCVVDNVIIAATQTGADVWACIDIDRAAGGVMKRTERVQITNCKVFYRGTAGNNTGIWCASGAASYRNLEIIICNNIIEEWYTATEYGIIVGYTDGLTMLGNVLDVGNATKILDNGNNLNITPSIASAGSYNVFK